MNILDEIMSLHEEQRKLFKNLIIEGLSRKLELKTRNDLIESSKHHQQLKNELLDNNSIGKSNTVFLRKNIQSHACIIEQLKELQTVAETGNEWRNLAENVHERLLDSLHSEEFDLFPLITDSYTEEELEKMGHEKPL